MTSHFNRRVFISLAAAALLCSALPAGAQENQGHIRTKVSPGRAGVFVDGKYMGPAGNYKRSRKYAVSAGRHEVKLVEPRYKEKVVTVNVEAGRTTVIKERLESIELAKPPFGRLKVEKASKYDAVYVNGAYYGHADEFNGMNQGQLLVPGEYTIRVDKGDGGSHQEKITITAHKITHVFAN